MPLISMQHQHKVVGLYNNKVETGLAEKNKKELLIRVRTSPFDPEKRTAEIVERLGSIRNANTTLNIKKGNNFLGFFYVHSFCHRWWAQVKSVHKTTKTHYQYATEMMLTPLVTIMKWLILLFMIT